MLDRQRHQAIADALWEAELRGISIASPAQGLEWSLADAYAVQAINVARRAERGDIAVGYKVGVSSKAVQQWLGLDEPDFGVLTDKMSVPDRSVLDMSNLCHPKAEGEIAFVLHSTLEGPGVTVADVLKATEFVLPAIEVADSRIRDWKMTGLDSISDNASAGRYVLASTPVSPYTLDMRMCGVALRKNGRVASTGAGAASMGDPCYAVAWLANALAEIEESLGAGALVLAGALCPVTPIVPGDELRLDIANIGSCQVRISGSPNVQEDAS